MNEISFCSLPSCYCRLDYIFNRPMKYDVRHNRDQHRFETQVENLLCVIDYKLDGVELSLTHVGVPKPIEGRGIAGELTRTALDWARSQHYRVIPVCPYVQAWLRRRPDYQDMVESCT